MTTRLANITVDMDIQPRANGLTQSHVADLGDALDQLPPVVVYRDPAGVMWLSEGFHRYEAYKRSGKQFIPTEIRDGGRDDAKLNAMASNQKHGLKRTNEDKRRAAVEVLKLKADWSDRKIAQHLGVSHELIRQHRPQVSTVDTQIYPQVSTVDTSEPVRRSGADGKTYTVLPQSPPTPTAPATRPDDEPELFAGEIRDGDPEPAGEDDSTSEQPAPFHHARPKGSPPPPKPEYDGELEKVMKSLTATATALTRFIRSDEEAAGLFVHYCTAELKLGWVLHDWKKGQELDAGTGDYVPLGDGPVFIGLRKLRRLLYVSHKFRRLPPKKLREKLNRPGEILPSLDIPEV